MQMRTGCVAVHEKLKRTGECRRDAGKFKELAGAEGFEPSPSSLTVRCPTSWTTPQRRRATARKTSQGSEALPHKRNSDQRIQNNMLVVSEKAGRAAKQYKKCL